MQQPTATEAAWSEHVVCMPESSVIRSTVQNVAAMPWSVKRGSCPPQKSLARRPCIAVFPDKQTPFDTQPCIHALVHSGDSAVLWCVWYDYLPGGDCRGL